MSRLDREFVPFVAKPYGVIASLVVERRKESFADELPQPNYCCPQITLCCIIFSRETRQEWGVRGLVP